MNCKATLKMGFFLLATTMLCIAAPPDGKGGGNGGGGGGGGDDGTPPSPEIAFGDTDGVYLMDADGGNVTHILQTSEQTVRTPSWSPDGSQLAMYSNLSEGLGIYRMNLDGTGLSLVTPVYDRSSGGPDWSPGVTASGTDLIVFFDLHPDSNFNLFVVAPDGSGYQALTNSTRDEFSPTWSPDAQQIVFMRDFEELVVADVGLVDGKVALVSETVVYAGPGSDQEMVFFPRFSNDGRRIVFSILDRTADRTSPSYSSTDLALIDLDNPGVVTVLTDFKYEEKWASFSPDDSKIAYFQDGSRGGIFVINTDGTGRTKLTRHGFDPYWRRASTLAKSGAAASAGTACDGDLNGDGLIGRDDLIIAVTRASRESGSATRGDRDPLASLVTILAAWGDCP